MFFILLLNITALRTIMQDGIIQDEAARPSVRQTSELWQNETSAKILAPQEKTIVPHLRQKCLVEATTCSLPEILVRTDPVRVKRRFSVDIRS